MPDELETILRLVADGKLTAEEAAPIIEALTKAHDRAARHAERAARHAGRHADRIDRHVRRAEERLNAALGRSGQRGEPRLRIRVTERGRQVVNLRIPLGFVETALRFVPGLGGEQAERIREAVSAGAVGPIIDVDDDGDGVLISVE